MEKKWLKFIMPAIGVVVVIILLISLFAKNGNKSVSGNSASGNTANGTVITADGVVTDAGSENGTTANGVTYKSVGIINTGNLTENGSGYEGTKGTGDFNYGEALQKSLLFYELQRSGDIPDETRCNWRADSCLNDGQDVGLDLTGGWYDAGDNVKFNLPMSYSAMILGWSILEDMDAYKESGQLEYALGNIKWANDYFIKCHPEDEVYYYQVGNGSQDHTFWGAAEVVEYRMERPSYCVTKDNPGSTVCGETAASLAVCSIVYKDIDKSYSDLCLNHAKSLYKFAKDTQSDSGYTMAAGFYDSWSGYYDELSLAANWLYMATGDKIYLEDAKKFLASKEFDNNWSVCWDDVHIASALLLAKNTGDNSYKQMVENHLDWWCDGITKSPKGLAWLDSWGSLRYATTTAYIASIYSQWDGCDTNKSKIYWDFAKSQVDYALGSTGFSYMVGFGDDYPKHPHHRTAQGSYADNMNEPTEHRHTLYGALVGGPDASDGYQDVVSNYNTNEVACDYNAGFTGVLAKMYSKYKGQTLVDFGAVEPVPSDEIAVEAAVNVDGQDFIEIKAYVLNKSAWPARSPEKLEMRYYLDLSEVYAAGGDASNIDITTNYMQAGQVGSLVCQNEEEHIYYLPVVFNQGDLYPGGQSQYKAEVQIRLRNPLGVWDNSNDPSYQCLSGNNPVPATKFALFENDKLIFGEEATKGTGAGTVVSGNSSNSQNQNNNNGNANNTGNISSATANGGSASNEKLSVKADYSSTNGTATSVSGTLNITNNGDEISLKNLKIDYYLTKEEGKEYTFACYHSAVSGSSGSYTGVNGCNGAFSASGKKEADTKCTISFADDIKVATGDTLVVNFCINYSDWSAFDLSKVYSAKAIDNIVITCDNTVIFGNEPK